MGINEGIYQYDDDDDDDNDNDHYPLDILDAKSNHYHHHTFYYTYTYHLPLSNKFDKKISWGYSKQQQQKLISYNSFFSDRIFFVVNEKKSQMP